MAETPTVELVLRDASWLAHRFDPGHDTIVFRHVERAGHAKATFLTDEYLGEEPDPFVVRRADAMAAAQEPAPVHFIFHSAFCCSTLLARVFDVPQFSMGLKEPVILNDVVGWRHLGAAGRDVAKALDNVLTLLARPFTPGEATIIKPSNVVNGLAPAMMGLRPQSKALLLHAPLPVFLKSVARKGMWGRLWVRELMTKQLHEGLIDLGFEQADYLGLTDLQAAAVGWLAQQALFGRMIDQFGRQRVRTLDSETLLDYADACIEQLAQFFGIGIDAEQRKAILQGPAFATDSKTGAAFSREKRDAAYDEAARTHADEIEKVLIWANAVAGTAGVPAKPGTDLLQD
jgi:hypothetical protein